MIAASQCVSGREKYRDGVSPIIGPGPLEEFEASSIVLEGHF